MRYFQNSLPAGSFIAAGLVFCLGCGSQEHLLEGSVTFDGQPVEKGSITLEPADGVGPAAGGTIAGGRFKVDSTSGLAPGNKIVRISAVRATGKKIEAGPPEPPGAKVDEVQQFIPAKYNDRSALTVQFDGGHKKQDFDLKSQPSR
jgi:hypothetical protein